VPTASFVGLAIERWRFMLKQLTKKLNKSPNGTAGR
jgi:hypothetical protein